MGGRGRFYTTGARVTIIKRGGGVSRAPPVGTGGECRIGKILVSGAGKSDRLYRGVPEPKVLGQGVHQVHGVSTLGDGNNPGESVVEVRSLTRGFDCIVPYSSSRS